jgi:hypothetical protein
MPPDPRVPDILLSLVQNIHDNQLELQKTLNRHIQTEPEEWAAALRSLMNDAFPEGDADGHRMAHEAQMREIENRAAFWEKMRFEIMKWGLIGFLGWAAVQLWLSFLHGPGK